jgi:hypothetical protein
MISLKKDEHELQRTTQSNMTRKGSNSAGVIQCLHTLFTVGSHHVQLRHPSYKWRCPYQFS